MLELFCVALIVGLGFTAGDLLGTAICLGFAACIRAAVGESEK